MASAGRLDEARREFARGRFLAMPIAGTIGWTIAGILGAILPLGLAVWTLFIIGGAIFWLGVLIGRLTGEHIIGGQKKPNEFDRLFLLTVLMASLVWAIAD